MTAPSGRYAITTTATSTATLGTGSSAPQVGDLCVVMLEGNTTSLPPITGINWDTGGGDAGFTRVNPPGGDGQTGSGTNRADMWWKVLTSSDFSAGVFKGLAPAAFANSGTTRWQIVVIAPGSGNQWGVTPLQDSEGNSTNTPNGLTLITLTGRTRSGVGMCCGVGTPGSAGTINWNATGGTDPYFDNDSGGTDTDAVDGHHYATGTGTCQADFKCFDTSSANVTIANSGGQTNTSHATILAFFQTEAAGTTIEVDPIVQEQNLGQPSEAGTSVVSITPDIENTQTIQNVSVFTTAEWIVGFDDPSWPVQGIALTVRAEATLGAGDLRFGLYKGSTLIKETIWFTLDASFADYELDLSDVVIDDVPLQCKIEVRSTNEFIPTISQIFLDLIEGAIPIVQTQTIGVLPSFDNQRGLSASRRRRSRRISGI